MSSPKSQNITWHEHSIDPADREQQYGHKGAVLWFTGLSGSGKSTLANEVAYQLFGKGAVTYVLDGDNVRHGLNRDLGFSPADRAENIRRIGEVANLFADAGALVCTAFISPYRKDRQAARDVAGPGRFVEVYCRCSLEACESRDPKGLYKKARAGEIPEFTGISAPYEAPEEPEIVVDTDQLSVTEAAEHILAELGGRGLIGG